MTLHSLKVSMLGVWLIAGCNLDPYPLNRAGNGDGGITDDGGNGDGTGVQPDARLPDGPIIDAMPDAFRQAVWLRDVEEFSYAEIASMLDVPIGTVMSRISRGRRMLYDRLAASRAHERTEAAG